jgi:phage shock protein A
MLEKIEARLEQARSGERPIELQELEDLFTSGCAEVLELEADSMRIKRRLHELRDQLRHIRTAIEFLQEERSAADASQ